MIVDMTIGLGRTFNDADNLISGKVGCKMGHRVGASRQLLEEYAISILEYN